MDMDVNNLVTVIVLKANFFKGLSMVKIAYMYGSIIPNLYHIMDSLEMTFFMAKEYLKIVIKI
jgi:hypothetical protein